MGGLSRQRYCCLNWISKESLVKSHWGVNWLYMSIFGGVLEQVGGSLEGIMGSWSIWGMKLGTKSWDIWEHFSCTFWPSVSLKEQPWGFELWKISKLLLEGRALGVGALWQ
jgi:hypothetical protein